MEDNDLKKLREDLAALFNKYNYTLDEKLWESWWSKYINTLNTYKKFPSKQKEKPSPSKLKKRLESLANKIHKDRVFFQSISQPDIFEEDSNIKYEEFCKSLAELAENLRFFEDHIAAYSEECPEGTFKKKSNSRLQDLINDMLSLIHEIDSNVSEPGYYDGQSKGILLELVKLSGDYLGLEMPTNNSLASAIKRSIRPDESSEDQFYITVNKLPMLNKNPKEQLREDVVNYFSAAIDYRSIAKELDINKYKVQQIIKEEKDKILRLRMMNEYEIPEIANMLGLTQEAVKKLISM